MAQASGAGQVLFGTSRIWPHHPEKCLAVSAAWAEADPERLILLLRAILQAQIQCDQAVEAQAIASVLAREDWFGLPEAGTRASLAGGTGVEQIRFHGGSAWFPAQAHALWFLRQMRRWGWIAADAPLEAVTRSLYRPDLLAPALAAEGILSPKDLPALEGDVIVPET
jgi:ABC-type nitrate/sulfonate/bicarbonate transport system substrate-binding protein